MHPIWLLPPILLAAWGYRRWRELQRAQYIREFELPKGLLAKLKRRRPELSNAQLQLVARGLRQFFLAYHAGGRQYVAMPSQVVDELWHEFILYTRHYQQFCRRAFGRFMHHTPAVVLSSARRDNSGLRRVWWYACKEENINPRQPSRLPLLFALDAKLGIADGFIYHPDCRELREGGDGSAHCGGDFSDASYDGGTAGLGDSSDSGGAHGDSHGGSHGGDGGDGGGGDGGGCGGCCGGGGD